MWKMQYRHNSIRFSFTVCTQSGQTLHIHSNNGIKLRATPLEYLQGLSVWLKCWGGASFIHSLPLSKICFSQLVQECSGMPFKCHTNLQAKNLFLSVGPGGGRGWKQRPTCQQQAKVSADEQRRRRFLFQVGRSQSQQKESIRRAEVLMYQGNCAVGKFKLGMESSFSPFK